ncbi:Crp/Fnr family transcriptional regulator [Capnocytophaga cynodegmi]|uniref:Cyclic nucleotide-binding domain protein n=1 Tax=Capnocytophaga cynodegmi TaxID=28189 RepID=A0A0B7H6T1_9FLAO|nr:cyclic nucleotide-binding domain-containing protein [Capnocytophaga cynodegmi]CEN33637.1 Cyclic nucleotide-binding domain protein [Capnocytophaga cynodegmi]
MEALLNAIQNYVPLSFKERELIKGLFSEISVSKNTHLLEAGNICKYLYFIKEGLFRHFIDDQTVHFSSENSFMCDLTSFSTQTPSIKSFEALENSILFRISYNDLHEFCNKVQNGERFNRLVVEEAFNKTVLYIYALQKQTPTKRYETFLQQFKGLSQRIPQYYIASYIGVTPQSLSRIRRKMVS